MARIIERKIIHILFGIALILLIVYNIVSARFLFYILVFGCFLSLASLKFSIPIVSWFLEHFEKKDEKIPGRGMLFFVAGSLLVLKIFPLDIALASVTILTFADSSSYLIGKGFGRTKIKLNNDKNIEGILFGFLIGTVFDLFFINFVEAFIATIGAMIVEYVEVKVSDENIDDNLLIPLVSGTLVLLLRIYGI